MREKLNSCIFGFKCIQMKTLNRQLFKVKSKCVPVLRVKMIEKENGLLNEKTRK